ncbi:protein-disulfide reductase DsbD [Marinospirillum minutulum]|uniref:protein-disulfide reductase DsbD n=1 Tax=Marinospirillum minutulum TaxID=64974 RepID=UPI00041DC3A1|nr:protein-disulfide reductase DsbD [Marinospirillum minutulum]
MKRSTLLLLLTSLLSSGFLQAAVDFLPANQAFKASVVLENQQLLAHWEIAEGYYLYQSRISIQANEQALQPNFLSQATTKNDPNFGLVDVFYNTLELTASPDLPAGLQTVELSWQGCAEAGLCYPPRTETFQLQWPGNTATTLETEQIIKLSSSPKGTNEDAGALATLLESSGLMWIVGTFFVLGLGLTFTPCVLPMLPILAGAIAGQGQKISTGKGLGLSVAYVLGMATTYTAAGVVVGYFGASMNLQTAMQNPIALSVFALIFVLLSLAMFGFYELQLPAFLRDKLNNLGNKPNQQASTSGLSRYAGLALLGFISALVVSPCVSAPLAGALIYISSTGDALLGGAALFALSLGMGVPLLLVGAGGGRLLPRAGVWMLAVKNFFGVLLLALAISLLARFLPASISLTLWGLLALVYAVHLGSGEIKTSWQKTRRGLAAALAIYAVALLMGVLAGQDDPLQPLAGLMGKSSLVTVAGEQQTLFTKTDSVKQLKQQLLLAKNQSLPVVLDFYADWCASCKVMEKQVFNQINPQNFVNQLVFLQLDLTKNTPEQSALLEEYQLFGPPALLYFSSEGTEVVALRTLGEIGLSTFQNQLQTLVNSRP